MSFTSIFVGAVTIMLSALILIGMVLAFIAAAATVIGGLTALLRHTQWTWTWARTWGVKSE